MRKIAVVLVLLSFLAGCGGKPQRKDSAGNVIAAGQDWSIGKKDARPKALPTPAGSFSPDAIKAFGRRAIERYYKCGVPPTLKPEQREGLPEGIDPNSGMPPPKNDFPLHVTITPTKGDPETPTRLTAVAPGQPGVRVVMVARFFDGDHHGMRAAKVGDLTGRAVFDGPVPKDAPKGLAYIYVSASIPNSKKSALKSVKFVVTGPGCR